MYCFWKPQNAPSRAHVTAKSGMCRRTQRSRTRGRECVARNSIHPSSNISMAAAAAAAPPSTLMLSSYQVCCQHCNAALWVRLAVGTTKVRCDEESCAKVFSVRVEERDAPARAAAAEPRDEHAPRELPEVLKLHNIYMKKEMARLRDAEPSLSARERFSRASSSWKTAAENPKNAPAGGGATAEEQADDGAADAAADGATAARGGLVVLALAAAQRGDAAPATALRRSARGRTM